MFLQITYDSSQLYFSSKKIHDAIVSMKPVLDWWHYLPNVYIIETSTSNEADIASLIIKEFQGLRFIITKIDINSPNGVLPQDAWDWMTAKNKKQRGYLKIKPQQLSPKIKTRQSNLLDDLLRFSDGKPIVEKKRPMTLEDLFKRNKK